MHGLHNADLIQDTLPCNLTAPIPYFADRDAKRKEFAALLRISGPAKRAAALKKSKETRERNLKAKKAGKVVEDDENDDGHDGDAGGEDL